MIYSLNSDLAADAPAPQAGLEGARPPNQSPKDAAAKGDRTLLHGEWNIRPVAGVLLCQPIPAG